MPSKRHKKASDLFQAACELASDAQAAFLDEACEGDSKLRAEVETLLAQDKEHPSFLENVAPDKGQHARRPKKKAEDGVSPDSTEGIAHTHAPLSIAIEGYDIVRELQRGGQGVVYQALQGSTKRKVAIKVLLEGPYASESAKKRFEREIELVAQLKHSNIIPIFHSGKTPEGHHYYVMDYVRGQPLNHYVRDAKPTLEEALALFGKVCDAVNYAHQKGVIHRDLKPSNILVDVEGEPRLLDFGLAKMVSGPVQTLVSVTGQVVGTLPYMSPEQTRGNPDEIDIRTDVYALGVMLYELLTGHYPYPVVGEMADVLKHIASTEPTPPSRQWTRDSGITKSTSKRRRAGECPIDNELQTIVLKALSKNRERRYQSADALREDILSYLRGEPIEAKRDSSLYVLRKSFRRHRARIAVMTGFVVVAAVALYVGSRAGDPTESLLAPSGSIRSLVVLPFENMSADPDTEYLSNEIPANIIDKLAGLSDLSVISRSGAFRFDPAKEDAVSFGRSLGATVVLTGQLNARGKSLTIRAELVDVATNQQLWSKRYPRELSGIMAVEADITQDISKALRLQLTAAEENQLATAKTVNPDAYRSYLQGRFWWSKFTPGSSRKALRHFEQAIDKDPTFANAHAELANTYILMGSWYGDMPPHEAFPQAQQAAIKAMEIDATLAEAHRSLAFVRLVYEWDWKGAEQEYSRAIRLNPDSSTSHGQYAILHQILGRFEQAHAERIRALELDPLYPICHVALGFGHAIVGEYDQAIKRCNEALKLDAGFPPAFQGIGYAYLAQGRYEDAIAAFQRATVGSRSANMLGWLGLGYAKAGRRAEALAILDELEEISTTGHGRVLAAMIHAALGNAKLAFDFLEIAYEERDSELVWINTMPSFGSLRSDPRFDDLLRRIGFEPDSKPSAISEAPSRKTMLAVLPFVNLSGDPEQEYFSDGMTEEMITRLGRLRPELLGVIARTSAMRYKNTDKLIDQIGRELGVAYVIEGGVRRSGNSVRISAQLIQVSDQTQIWGDSYTRDLSDVFAIQA